MTTPKLTSNTLIRQVDLPTWEWIRQMPAVSSALSSACAAQNGNFHPSNGRYIYFIVASLSFWRYDTWADAWMQLSSPPFATSVLSDIEFLGSDGPEGRVLSATSTTLEIAAVPHRMLETYEVRIIGGTGRGQRRYITTQAEPVVADRGIPTSVTAGITCTLTDTTKAWTINQWAGYSVRIEFGTGVSQVRRILYSDATSITYCAHGKFSENVNAAPAQMSPLPTTGAAISVYSIESSTLTIDSAWATTPDATSIYRVLSGCIAYTYSGAFSPTIYNIAEDTWYILPIPALAMAATSTESRMECSNETQSIWWNGLATAGTTTTLTDSRANWEVNEWVGKWVWITSGTGEGQIRKISANTATQLTWVTAGTAPTTTSRYAIEGYDAGTATSGGASTLTDTAQAWATNRWVNYRLKIVFGTGKGQWLNILSNTATVLTLVQPWASCFPGAVNPDSTSVYVIVGDNMVLYSAHGATAAILRTSLTNGITHIGAKIDQGAVCNGSAQYSDFPPVAIASGTYSNPNVTITTVNPHGFRTGWTIKHAGDTGAGNVLNNISASIVVTGATTYTYNVGAGSAAWTITAGTTSILKDASKNWTVNEFVGKLVRFSNAALLVGGTQTQATAVIASNTADTLTFAAATATAAITGVSNYVITQNDAIGRMDGGIATGAGQLTTALVDTSKTWVVNIHVGRRMRYLSHLGEATEVLITANTANTLTFAASTLPVAGATAYAILGQATRGLGTCLEFQSNSSRPEMAGRYLYSFRGGATIGMDRFDITNNACLQMASLQQTETLTTGTMAAYDGEDCIYFTKDATQRMYCLNLVTGVISGAPQFPYVAGTAIIGNRMTITKTRDRLKYLILNRHSNVEMFRTLLFWEPQFPGNQASGGGGLPPELPP